MSGKMIRVSCYTKLRGERDTCHWP